MEKQEILAEIRRTAEENGGKPLGINRFRQATGIGPYDWGRFWPRFSEAQQEAGYEPNQITPSFSHEYLYERIIALSRELRHYPTLREIVLKRHNDASFPAPSVFKRLGSKDQIMAQISRYCEGKTEYTDVMELLGPIEIAEGEADNSSKHNTPAYGFVYLVKGHPGEYKIGRTNLVDRRLSELGATASVQQMLIHEIKTDDVVGIEAYWHKRFQAKRMRGEWFKLNGDDVQSFKRWKKIF